MLVVGVITMQSKIYKHASHVAYRVIFCIRFCQSLCWNIDCLLNKGCYEIWLGLMLKNRAVMPVLGFDRHSVF